MAARHITKGPFVNEGERVVVARLVQTLPPSAIVISNLYLPNRGDTLEIDALAITAYGIVVIETKDWRGHLVFDEGGCTRDGERVDDPRPRTSAKAKVMHGRLSVATAPLVILARSPASLLIRDRESVPVKPIDDAIDLVRTGQILRYRARGVLSASDVRSITDRLTGAHVDAHERTIGPFRIGKPTDSKRVDEFWASEIGQSERRVRLRRYSIDSLASPDERKDALLAATRSFEALRALERKRLRALPNVYTLFVDPEDDSTLWMAYEGVEGRSLLDVDFSVKEKIVAIVSVAEALHECHAAGVLHRALSPDRLLVPNGEALPVILDFDLAKLSGRATIARGPRGRALASQTRAAPELRGAPSLANAPADVYSLGFTAVEVLVGRKLKSHKDARDAARSLRPRELASALVQSLEELPQKRTKDMGAFADALRRAMRS